MFSRAAAERRACSFFGPYAASAASTALLLRKAPRLRPATVAAPPGGRRLFCGFARQEASSLVFGHHSDSGASPLGGLALLSAAFASAAAVAAAEQQRRRYCGQGAARCSSATRRVVVARDNEVPDGELRQIRIPPSGDGSSEGAILLAKIDGKLYATGASCSHYSAPLAQGVAAKDKLHVVCPWHDAAFDLRTGQPVRGAGLQAIPVYPVSVEGGDIVVEVPKEMEDFVAPKMVRRCPNDRRVFVVLGGGAAGVAAADSLRQEGFTGRIVLASEEKHLPYDRPVLSKNLAKASDPGSLALRESSYFEEHDIEFLGGKAVQTLDAEKKVISFVGGDELRYDCAVVATGAKPRALPIPGGDLPGVFPLRTPEDALKIAAACTQGKQVVVVGSSFIGMEVAGTIKRRGCDVTVLGMEAVPFERVLGKRVGEALRSFFQEKGINFVGSSVVNEIQQTGDGLSLSLKSGKKMKCDAVVVGVGVIPNASFVTGAEKGRDGSILTDECLQTSAPGLFAAGDVARYRMPKTGEHVRIEHWDVATSQGRVAAKGMCGKPDKFDQTPFFWTSLLGKNLRYVGHALEFDEMLVDGSLSKMNFVAYYCHKNEVKAVATMGRDPVAVAAGELMRLGKMPTAAELKKGAPGKHDLVAQLRELTCAGA